MESEFLKNRDNDFLHLEDSLTNEQIRLMQEARELAQTEIKPLIKDAYDKGEFPVHIPRLLGDARLLGADLKGDHCHGYDAFQYGLIMRELERVDSGLRSFVSVQSALVMYAIESFGSLAQKEQWLPSLVKGEAIGAFALTEAHGGSDPANMKVRAKFDGKSWRLSGEKKWVTNGPIANVCVVWAHTDDAVRAFLLPLPNKKVQIRQIKNKYSMRVSHSSEMSLDSVVLPSEALLPKSKGIGSALKCLNQARFGIIWGVLGAAEDCLAEALNYSKNRELFQRKLSSLQLVQSRLADMYSDLSLAQLYAFRLAQLKDEGKMKPAHISLGKANHVEVALTIARTCRDILGANGILSDFDCMRHMMNLETVSTYEGTRDIHRLVLGQHLTGTSAFT